MSGRSGPGGQSLKSRQFYEMFRTQSRVLKVKEAHDEMKSSDQAEQQKLDNLYKILKEKEGSGKGLAPTAPPTTSAPVVPTPTAFDAPSAPATATTVVKPPTITITTEEKVEVISTASADGNTAASKPLASPRLTAAEAAKEVADLDRLMQLSLRENDELSKKILEMEIKMKLLEHNLPASKMDDLKSGSLRGADLRGTDASPDTSSTAVSDSNQSVGFSSASKPLATFDEGQKKVVFSQKLRTREYFEMFKTRSKLIVPGKEGRGQLSRAAPVSPKEASDAQKATPASTEPVVAPAIAIPVPTPVVIPVVATPAVFAPAVTVTPSAVSVPASAPAPAPEPEVASAPTVAPTVEDAKAEVAELNDMVENSIQENEELQKEVANMRTRLEEAESRAHKYKHKSSSSKKKLGKNNAHIMAMFTAFLVSGGKDRAKLLEEVPSLKEAFEKFDAANK